MADWYYAKNNQQKGPVTTDTLREMAASGEIEPGDMVWHAGMANWAPASGSTELYPNGVPASRPADEYASDPDPRPRRRRHARYDDDHDDDYDDDYDRQPRRRTAPPARRGLSSGAWVAIICGIVAGVLLIVGIIIWVIVANSGGRDGRQISPPATVNASLENGDRRYQNKYAEYFPIRLTRGRFYTIEMTSREIDSYLIIRDPMGRTVARNDDGGAGLNSRIVFRPQVSGQHTIITTSFGGGQTGRFTLRVR